MKKIWIWIIIIIAMALAIVLFITQTTKESEEIKIGAILPLTGDFAILGEEIKRGIEIAIEEVKNTGLFLTIFYEDDQSLSPVAAINAANKLINMNKIDVGLTMLVEESRPISPIFNKNRVPLIVLWDSNRFIKEAGIYIFSNGFSTEKAGEKMAEFSYLKLGLKKIAVIKHVDPWAEIISESFEDKFRNLGGEVIIRENLQSIETDYRTAITKIKNTGPDGVYFPLVPPNSALFLTQAKEMGLKVTLLTGDSLIQQVIEASGNSSEGVYFTNIYTESEKAAFLAEKYRERYKKDHFDITLVSFGYDGIMKVMEAIEINKESLQKALISVLGKSRSADRVEKIYRIIERKPLEIE